MRGWIKCTHEVGAVAIWIQVSRIDLVQHDEEGARIIQGAVRMNVKESVERVMELIGKAQ
jgi:hypothetical protein